MSCEPINHILIQTSLCARPRSPSPLCRCHRVDRSSSGTVIAEEVLKRDHAITARWHIQTSTICHTRNRHFYLIAAWRALFTSSPSLSTCQQACPNQASRLNTDVSRSVSTKHKQSSRQQETSLRHVQTSSQRHFSSTIVFQDTPAARQSPNITRTPIQTNSTLSSTHLTFVPPTKPLGQNVLQIPLQRLQTGEIRLLQ